MGKIKVGFEVTDTWNKGDFREFIQGINQNPNYELWIISNDDISSYILSIGEQLRLPNNRVIVTNFTADKVQAISDNNLDIYFENLQYVVEKIDAETDCNAILVGTIPNKYQVKPQYQVEFERIIKELTSNEENCENTNP